MVVCGKNGWIQFMTICPNMCEVVHKIGGPDESCHVWVPSVAINPSNFGKNISTSQTKGDREYWLLIIPSCTCVNLVFLDSRAISQVHQSRAEWVQDSASSSIRISSNFLDCMLVRTQSKPKRGTQYPMVREKECDSCVLESKKWSIEINLLLRNAKRHFQKKCKDEDPPQWFLSEICQAQL